MAFQTKNQTRENERNKIISKSREMFLRYGFKSVTMNDIAREQGLSKKTLYLHFQTKEELILKVVSSFIEEEKENTGKILGMAKDAIGEMLELSVHINDNLQKTNPAAIFDLQKYYRRAWDLIQSYRKDFVYSVFKKNLKRGIKEGLYRKDIIPDIVTKLYMNMAESILDDARFPFPDYNKAQLHLVCFRYHIHGIATQSGLQYLDKYDKAQKDKA